MIRKSSGSLISGPLEGIELETVLDTAQAAENDPLRGVIDLIVDRINAIGWNTIRWGHQHFGTYVVDTLVRGMDFPIQNAIVLAGSEVVAKCSIVGNLGPLNACPVFTHERMPPHILAVVSPTQESSYARAPANVASHINVETP